MAAARIGVNVCALIGVDATASAAAELDTLRGAGVSVHIQPLGSGPVFDNRRTPTGRQQFALAASDMLTPAMLPEAWRAPDAALLAPVAGELGHDWATAFEPATFVGLAAQGLLRRLDPGKEVVRLSFEHGPVIHRADAIAISREDIVGGVPPIRDWTRAGQQLLVTHGKRGCLALMRTESGLTGHFMPPLPQRKAVDPTGAGDTFVAAWLAALMLVGDGWRPLAIASVMSSLAVMGVGLATMPTAADICQELLKLRDSAAAS
jgi:hypothetical protein